MGQEVIEIGAPLKDLPMGLEEEPSAEDDNDDDEKASLKVTSNAPLPATKKDMRKAASAANVKKEVQKVEGLNSEEEEARIEKELSEIYKDTADYKSDSAEEKDVAKETETSTLAPVTLATDEDMSDEEMDTDKAIGRQRNNFKFQPDSTDAVSVERFRTSMDEISCNNKQRLKGSATSPADENPKSKNDAFRVVSNGILLITAILSYVFICS